jgi:SAM-dependent methyltransferase
MKKFDIENIYSIYNKHIIKPNSYYERFSKINEYLSEPELIKYKNIDPPRVVSIIDFKEWIEKFNIKTGDKLLYTCESDPELCYIDYSNKTYLPYPPYDLHNFDIEEKNHDLVIFNQTIEHLYNPFIAIQNLYDHTKDGGFLYTTVPTINIPHMTPIHFWGITPIGLCLLMMSVGFNVVECGYWGNKKYIDYIFTNNDWPGYKDISITDFNLGCDNVCQSQTWILVQK